LHLALSLLAASLAACERTAPPAPFVERGASMPMRGRAQPMVPHPDTVTVAAGETLYGIARRYDVPLRSVIEANGLAPPYRLTAGRTLKLPQIHQHIVRRGETLYSISRLYGVDTTTLARRNDLAPPYRIRVDEALVLPAPVETAGGAPVIQATTPAAIFAVPAAPASTVPPPAVAAAAPPVVASREAAQEARPKPAAPPPAAPSQAATLSLPPPSEAAPPRAPPPAAPPEKLAALPPPPAPAPERPGVRSFIWPVHGRVIGSYGNGEGGTHNDGINIAAPAGTPVLAADDGTVAYAGNELRGYGNLVLIKHANGWLTAYAHNSVLLVKRGDRVRRGQMIARVGATGAVGAPQLHFEIRHGTRALDPSDYLPAQSATASR
jgi:murein DD-endopeptidase MepM/ murein hydrolase activator NlpD